MKMEEILINFNFETEDDFYEWKTSFVPTFLFDADMECCLYTDGDDGVALLRISDVFGEGGLSVALIDCAYCDIDASNFIAILTILIKGY
jgi:hypothetical protein